MCHNIATADTFYAMHHTADELADIRTKFQEALDSEGVEDAISSSSPLLILSDSSSCSDGESEQPVKKKRVSLVILRITSIFPLNIDNVNRVPAIWHYVCLLLNGSYVSA